MADKRINALANTAPSTASDDFIAVDGTTNGTRKLSAFSPTFGGNATVTGTLTVNSTFASTSSGTTLTSQFSNTLTGATNVLNLQLRRGDSANGFSRLMWNTGSTTEWSFGSRAGDTNLYVWDEVANAERLKIASSTGNVSIAATSASTTTSSGALVVGNGTSGGLGVGGAIVAGGTITSTASTDSGLLQLNLVNSSTGTSASSLFRFNAGTRTATLQAYNDTHATLAGQLRIGTSNGDIVLIPSGVTATTFGSSTVTVNHSTASTSTSTGALVVSGGVGVAGKVTSTALGLANTSQSATAWGDVGVQLSVAGAVLTDTSSSGTVGRIVTNSIAASALAASNTTTYTAAASLFIAGAPTANTNVTITNAYALYTAGGRINFQGLPTSSAGLQAGTLWNDAGTLKVA